jgi:DNA-binding beta-propeller fold protein YncE
MRTVTRLVLLAVLTLGSPAAAQIAVSSNDNKAVLVDGVNTVPASPKPDTVSIINLSVSPPRVIAELNVPGGWSAPPQSVAVAPDESIALVASSAKVDPANPTRTVFNDELTVIDLKASPPVVLTTLRTGRRAAGVSINPAGTLALVANRAEGTISVFTIAGKTVTPAGKVDLGDAASEPSLPVFTPDGRTVLVTLNVGNRVAVLSVNGTAVEYTKRDIVANHRPYGLEISPRGDVAIVANIGNGPTGGVDTLTVVDLTAQPPRVVGGAFPGIVPEGIALSPDGRYLATSTQNGTNVARAQPWFHDFGMVKVYRLDGQVLTPVAEARSGRWCQGLAWSRAADTLLVQCAADNEINVFGFNGRQLTPRPAIKVSGSPTGIRTAQPRSRP